MRPPPPGIEPVLSKKDAEATTATVRGFLGLS